MASAKLYLVLHKDKAGNPSVSKLEITGTLARAIR
jgi:hypothetical protein